jgi:Ecdysteroid kinase-like family
MELREFLVPTINELAKAEGFEDGFTVTTEKASNVGDGFMGLLLRVTVVGARKVGDESVGTSKFAVVVKMPPDSPNIREQFRAIPIFEREALFYTKYCPMMEQFQHDRGITDPEEGFFAVPKCYKVIADAESGNYAMILEDLKASDFRLFNKYETIDLAHVSVFVKRLARYHALSFAMRDQQPEMFEDIRSLKDVMMDESMNNAAQFEGMMLMAANKAITSFGPLEEFKIEKLEKLKTENFKIFEFCAMPANFEPYGVLMHGDCWNNNMMYSYDAVSLKSQEV